MLTLEQTEALRALYDPDDQQAKFCHDAERWDAIAQDVAEGLGLFCCVRPRRILDLGCGFGYFLNACRVLGHDAMGVDTFNPLVRQATRILGVPYTLHTIVEFEPLPPTLKDYDLVTMHGVNLLRATVGKRYWQRNEYAFLTNDIRHRLRPKGRFVIRPNVAGPGSPTAILADREWWTLVAGPEATVTKQSNHTTEIQIRWDT